MPHRVVELKGIVIGIASLLASLLAMAARPAFPQSLPQDSFVARNQQSGQTEYKRVERTTIRRVHTVVTVQLADNASGQVVETITATPEHPFYVAGKGFVEAQKLGIGTQVVTRAGPHLVVKSVHKEISQRGYTVYNLVVEGDHTYFVGNANGGVWVHNPGGPCDWFVHSIAPDWAVKGAHITSNGVELAVRPGAGGTIIFKPVFSGGGKAAAQAATDAQQLLDNGQFLSQLLAKVQAAKPYVLQFPNEGGVGRSAELHFLEKALLQRLGQ